MLRHHPGMTAGGGSYGSRHTSAAAHHENASQFRTFTSPGSITRHGLSPGQCGGPPGVPSRPNGGSSGLPPTCTRRAPRITARGTTPWIIRIPESLCPLPHILSITDTLDLSSIEAHRAQDLGGFVLQSFVIR